MTDTVRIISNLADWRSRREVCDQMGISKNQAVVALRNLKRDGYVESAKAKKPWNTAFVELYRSTGKLERLMPISTVTAGRSRI